MITLDTSTVTLDELEEKVLTMGQHVDHVLSKEPPCHSSAVMSVDSTDIDSKLDKMTKQLSQLSTALMYSRSGPFNRNEGEGRGREGGRNPRGLGRIKKYRGNCGGDHHNLQCTRATPAASIVRP